MKTKNTYAADLNLNPNESSTLKFSNDEGQLMLEVKIRRVDEENYEMMKATVEYEGDAIIDVVELIERRYCGKIFDVEAFDQRMRDMQYEIRKALKEDAEEYDAPKEEAPKPEPKKQEEPKRPEPPKLGLEGAILQMVYDGIESQESVELIRKTAKKMLDDWGIVPNQTELIVKREGKPEVKVGKQHKDFEMIMQVIACRENIALVGPAGSGKTTIVSNVAKALDLTFYSKSVSAQTGVHEFFGYQDATGTYVNTLFRTAYEFGGVFLFDEFDNGNPNVLAACNQATSNEACAFPDGMVQKHPDFVCVMAGNTFGHGATSEYVGRNKIDGATLDRFAFIYFDYDEEFEYYIAPNKEWCKKVQAIRKRVSEKKIRAIVSPRATVTGGNLLNAGMNEEQVMKMTIYKGLTQDEIAMMQV